MNQLDRETLDRETLDHETLDHQSLEQTDRVRGIAVFGLGYVGTVTAACFSGIGHRIVGVDVAEGKVRSFNEGTSPVLEDGVDELLADGLANGRLEATTAVERAVATTDVALICVGTPSRPNGDIDLSHVEAVASQIGSALARSDQAGGSQRRPYTVVVRSTVMPGTAQRVAQLLEQASGRELGAGLGVAVNPEFLREGQGVADFMDPPLILIGADDDATAEVVLGLYEPLKISNEGEPIERKVVPCRVAELIKYANNSWHATKITFANEIGLLAQSLGVDGRDVMEIVCSDKKLNISAAYLRPGFAFGGSCLPKDVRALNFAAKERDVPTPLLSSLLASNSIQVQRLIDQLIEWDGRRIGFVGLAFKPGTDDLRESPMVEVVERMLGKGFDCQIFDPDLSAANLVGSNQAYIDQEIPHLSQHIVDGVDGLVRKADIVVVSKTTPDLHNTLASAREGDNETTDLSGDQIVVDLIGLPVEIGQGRQYFGVAW